MNRFRKALCVALVLLLLVASVSAVPVADLGFGITASALDANGSCGDNATYTFDSATGELVISGTGAIYDEAFFNKQEIKNVIIGDGIAGIGTETFGDCNNLTSVDIGDSVTTIGDDAFRWCMNLTSVKFSDSVTTIGMTAFYECRNLTSVDIPDSVTSIGEGAFCNCYKLASVNISNSVTTIEYAAFWQCYGLTNVDIPDSVVIIGNGAFYECDGLISVVIPESVTSIGKEAFYDCDNLTDVYYAGSEEEWNAIEIGENNTGLDNATIHFGEEYVGCEHSWDNGTETIKADCFNDGEIVYRCNECGEIKTEKVNRLEHIYSAEFTVDMQATCYREGEQSRHCMREGCIAKIDTEKLPMIAHDLGEYESNNDATCENNGTKSKRCKVCTYKSKPIEVPGTALGHTYTNYISDGNTTCTVDGTQTAYCDNGCGMRNTIIKSATGHKFVPGEGTTATCTEPGKITFICANGCGTTRTESNSPALGHDYAYVSNGDATCSSDGTKTGKCIRCDNTSTVVDIGSKKDHEMTDFTLITPATCIEDGEEEAKCFYYDHCGYSELITVDALGHEMSKIEGYSATCTESGMNTYYACKRCDKFFKDKNGRIETTETDEIVAPYGHDYWDIDSKQETCTEDGYWVWKCFDCGHTYTETIPATGHSYPSTWSVLITPDCQNTGFAVKVCFGCHDVIAQVVPKAGHADNDGDSHCDTCNCEIIVEEPEIPDEPADDSADEPADEPEEKPCDCNCHAGGIKAFFFKLTNFFAKIFDKNARVCDCGKAH